MSKKRKIEFRDGHFRISSSDSPPPLLQEKEKKLSHSEKNNKASRPIRTKAKLNGLRNYLRPGQFYRLSDFATWSKSLPCIIPALMAEGTLVRPCVGLYYCPQKSAHDIIVMDDRKLINAFLKDHRFLLILPEAYYALGINAAPHGDKIIVYNHKRHEPLKLDKRVFHFYKKARFPLSLSTEFLLVDVVNNIRIMNEDKRSHLEVVRRKAREANPRTLVQAVRNFGNSITKQFFAKMSADDDDLDMDSFLKKIRTPRRPGPKRALSSEQIQEVRLRRRNGESLEGIARFYNVSSSMIAKHTGSGMLGQKPLMTHQQRQEAKLRRINGEKLEDIAKLYNVSPQYLARRTVIKKEDRKPLTQQKHVRGIKRKVIGIVGARPALTAQQKRDIQEYRRQGYTVAEIAQAYNVSTSTIVRNGPYKNSFWNS